MWHDPLQRVKHDGWPQSPLAVELAKVFEQSERVELATTLGALSVIEHAAVEARHFPTALSAAYLTAQLAYQQSLSEVAREAGCRALELARQLGDMTAEADLLALLALVAFEDGRSKDGHDHLLDAIALYDQLGETHEVPPLMRLYGEHLAILGAIPEAQHALRLARDRFAQIGDKNAIIACDLDLKAISDRQQ